MNPLFGQQSITIPQNLKTLFQTLCGAKNPAEILQNAMGNNPLGNIMQMCNGKEPREMFYEECRKRNINPEEFLSQLGIK